jgi:hypothetical protein
MWLCCIDLIFSIPYHAYVLIDNAINHTVDPWISWKVTQFDWYRVDFYRRVIIDMTRYPRITLIPTICLLCTCSYVFFLLFGFTDEAIESYKTAYYFCLRPFGVKRPDNNTSSRKMFQTTGQWVNKLLGRESADPQFPVSKTAGLIPMFGNSHQQQTSISWVHPKKDTMKNATDTLNWEDDITNSESESIVGGYKLTVPDYDEKGSKDDNMAKGGPNAPSSSTTSQDGSSRYMHPSDSIVASFIPTSQMIS